MSPFLVLLIGVLFIITAIGVLKMHPFFALVLAGVLVGVLSPQPLGEGAGVTEVASRELLQLKDGFEDWSVDAGEWRTGVPTSGPGAGKRFKAVCAATNLEGHHAATADSRLVSPSVDVPAEEAKPRLELHHWFRWGRADFGEVQIQDAGGAWTPVSSLFRGSSDGWVSTTIDLSPYAGRSVRLAFRFHAEDSPDEAGADTAEGWYIDSVRLTTTSPVPFFLRTLRQMKYALTSAATALGDLVGKIGIVIALAAVIGQCLMESGAADKIIRRLLAVLGEKRASISLLGSGYFLSVPVFFDTVFYLLVPLARALRMRTGRNFVLYVMAICAGGAMTHSIVPPTPGPLLMQESLGLNLGTAILGGFIIGLPVALFGGLVVGGYMNRKLDVPFRDAPGTTKEQLEEIVKRSEDELPGFLVSALPVVLPVVLITTHSIVGVFKRDYAGSPVYDNVFAVTQLLGDKHLALFVGAGIALWVLARQKKYSLARLTQVMEPAILSAGVIILITAAGGSFGSMLKATGLAQSLEGFMGDESVRGTLLILIAWGTASILKIAQGSGTVAIAVSAAIMGQVLDGVTLPYHKIYIFAAIAFGSKCFSWMNDSGFWVVCKMSGFTQEETLKTWTLMLGSMGVFGLGEVLVLSWLLPQF